MFAHALLSDWQVTDIWCDHLTKLMRVVVCGQIVPDVEPYKRDKRQDVIENQCLGLSRSNCSGLVFAARW